jgi:hypothetical protein
MYEWVDLICRGRNRLDLSVYVFACSVYANRVCDCLWRVLPFLFAGHCSQTAACEYKETITDTSDSVVASFCVLAFTLPVCGSVMYSYVLTCRLIIVQVMAVLRPIRVTITNFPTDGFNPVLEIPDYPFDPTLGTHTVRSLSCFACFLDDVC